MPLERPCTDMTMFASRLDGDCQASKATADRCPFYWLGACQYGDHQAGRPMKRIIMANCTDPSPVAGIVNALDLMVHLNGGMPVEPITGDERPQRKPELAGCGHPGHMLERREPS